MALTIGSGAPTILIRREAYERSGLSRSSVDDRFALAPDEFRVEGTLVAVGPIYAASERMSELIAELEGLGHVYYDDFFELSGNWPDWLRLHASNA